MSILCFYHSGDFDGKCSAAIIKMKIPNVILKPIDYGEEFPWKIINKSDIVYMVDYSLPENDMLKLNDICTFIWIDHHITAIQQIDRFNMFNISGLRYDGYAACQLTWKYCFPTKKMPKVVDLLGNYDIWNHKDPDVVPFQMGLKLYELDPDKDFKQWKKLFFPTIFFFPYYKRFIDIGKYIVKYQNTINKQMLKNAKEVTFEGYNCIALNTMYGNSMVFTSLDKVYDIKILYYNNGKHWVYTLYSDDNSNVNVSKIVKTYNGGGHFHAAGFNDATLLL